MSQQKQAINEKTAMAFKTMETIGIERQRVKPVLKRLLYEFDNHWEHIEAENYRALADAIFEAQDSQEGCSADNKKGQAVAKGPREKTLKLSDAVPHNPRREGTACQTPFQNKPPKKRPLLEDSTLSTANKPVLPVPTLPQARVQSKKSKWADASNKSTHNPTMSNNNHAVALPHTEGRSIARCSSGISNQNKSLISLGEPKMQPESDQPGFGPLAVMHPPHVLDSSENSQPDSDRSSKEKAKGKEKETLESDEGKSTHLEIAVTRDVNLSFICRDNLLRDPNFQTPSIETVCRDVEERCLASFKIHDPTFSLLNVFTEMCRSFSELGYTPEQKRRNGNISISPSPGAQHLFEGLPCHLSTSFNPISSMFNMALVSTSVSTPHYSDDISRGEEMVQISIERDKHSSEAYPFQFHYIARNIPYQNAYISISLARIGDESCCSDCFDDCLQKPFACACASETGGVFAYSKDGLLHAAFLDACMTMLKNPKQSSYFYCNEGCPLERVKNDEQPEKCKGHLMRKFIKECWAKCRCKRSCGNRVVQRGITCNLQVFKAEHQKGWGLRTMEDLPKGKFVCEYVGEILTNIELYDRQMSSRGDARHTYPVLLDADWGTEGVLKDEEALCLDATYYGNIARFINHRCFDGNLIGIPVEIETPDHHYYHLAFFTTREVSAMEELSWDYGIDFDDDKHPIEAFPCRCGSKYCRDYRRLAKARSKKLISS